MSTAGKRRPMRVPFGSYKGERVCDLPDDYLGWLAGIAYGPLRDAVEAELAARKAATEEVRSAAAEMIAAGFRSLAYQAHPDRGGTDEAMRQVLAARDWLRTMVTDG